MTLQRLTVLSDLCKDAEDFSKGTGLEELHMLLKQTVMIRRLKEHVLVQLPPKRRQIIRLVLKKSDIAYAVALTEVASCSSHKMIIFAHHHKVLDGVQEFVSEKGISYVRIDGHTPAYDRQSAIQSFQSSKELKIAIIGILVGGSGLNLSAAQNVVFLELPKEPAHMQQAEDRAHRRGQKNAVNIYIFCAKEKLC
ncbi:unnamed protein product [Cuscuta campestris]|uniref:Helicase C-terminal domain-containing protein n=1 Tax=Cuscuta campestris TaxID=132261 RepID=A0A484MJM3_9ASTE|nr:unnamed protein product [Cuscuta campestris]